MTDEPGPFGRGVKAARLARGLTAEEAAERAGVTRKTWSRLETGQTVRNDTLRAAEHLFGLPAGSVARAYHDGAPFPAVSGSPPETDSPSPLAPAPVPVTAESVFVAAIDLPISELRRLRDKLDAVISYVDAQRGDTTGKAEG